MQSKENIVCPECGTQIPLTETLAGPLLQQVRDESQKALEAERLKAQAAEAALTKERAALASEKLNLEAEVAEKLAAKRPEYEAAIRKAVAAEMEADLKSREAQIETLRKSRDDAQAAQLEAEKAKLEAEKKAASVELEVLKQVNAKIAEIREEEAKKASDAAKLKLDEKDMLIRRLTEQAEDLKRKAEAGSQRDQGEVAEIELQELLSGAFPWDEISEIKSGVRGADVLQRVKTGAETVVGSILFERKRAQGWGGDWIAKAKQDARKEKADAVVIVTDVLPKGSAGIDVIDEVCVCLPSFAVTAAKMLRERLLETANARRAAEGLKTNAERAYAYLLGPDFINRLKGIAEPFVAMQNDLESERRTMTQRWARRQKQIDRVLEAAFGMRGDIEALAGADLPELEAVEMKALVETEAVDEAEVLA